MSWLGAVRTASGGMLRHKVQAVAIGLVLLVSTASATLGLALLAAANTPFTRAFGAQNGTDVTITVDTARAGPAALAATRGLGGVTAAAGPFAESTVAAQFDGQPFGFGQMVLAGRASPGGPVDDVVLSAGHWPDGPGQVVLDATPGGGGPVLGSVLTISGVPGSPALVVVGFGNSVTNTADGWVAPAEISRLQAPGAPRSAQMLYRFTHAAGYGEVRADVAEVTGALPPHAVTGAASWLAAENAAAGNGAIMEPFVVAFALIGLAMAVLIVGNVVSGAVVASYQRIGVLKSVGLTPAQVVLAYLSRVGWPALAGCLAGVVAGNALAIPVLQGSSDAYGVGSQHVPWWATVAGPTGMLALVMLAGFGLAAPFARPARTAVTLAAIAFGATAVIFAFGLNSSLSLAAASQTHSATIQVRIEQFGPGDGPGQAPSAAQDAAVAAALGAQPGTRHDVALYQNQVKVPGIAGNVSARAFGGDASWTGYGMIAGRWYDAPGEVDVNTAFLNSSGLAVGDTATVNTGTAQVTVRIAGEVFEPSDQPVLFGSTQTLPGVGTAENLQEYDVALRPGTSSSGYVQAVNRALGGRSPWQATTQRGGGKFYTIASGLVGLLSLMVAVAAGLGVLNTVLMTTRDRAGDLGVFKALGMRPGQVLTMVVCWIAGPAVVAAAIAAPAAVALNAATLRAMAGTAHTGIPASFAQVFPPSRLALLSLAALAIAATGALLPASWAARARPAVALHAE
jgi:putative ABC transport system permease protein